MIFCIWVGSWPLYLIINHHLSMISPTCWFSKISSFSWQNITLPQFSWWNIISPIRNSSQHPTGAAWTGRHRPHPGPRPGAWASAAGSVRRRRRWTPLRGVSPERWLEVVGHGKSRWRGVQWMATDRWFYGEFDGLMDLLWFNIGFSRERLSEGFF